ncbi:hypothetical protein [Hoeflea sp.]|uniref:hypothetical protein n=1 Tax=Hoeflea sp. TaxID=1940281 RepID=UPI003B02E21B
MLKFHPVSSIAILSLLFAPGAVANDTRPDQLVIVSFDGAHDNKLWQKSRDIAQRTGARFTYFLSCTFLMTRDQRWSYQAPTERPGRSNVGFASDQAEVNNYRLAPVASGR